ncbi:MAG: hypothetical protein ACOC20_02585 [Oceanicaulis sp.]
MADATAQELDAILGGGMIYSPDVKRIQVNALPQGAAPDTGADAADGDEAAGTPMSR